MTRALPIIDTDPITLTEASELVLRGVVTVSALRAEIRRGNLTVERIGKNLFTTPAAIRDMRERCRVNQPRPASISGQTTEPGSSETAKRSSELDALKASVTALKSGSRSISKRNTSIDQRSAVNPIPFPSRKC